MYLQAVSEALMLSLKQGLKFEDLEYLYPVLWHRKQTLQLNRIDRDG